RSVAPPRSTIAVLEIDGGQLVGAVAEQLAESLREFGSVALLQTGDLSAIERAETAADRVVLSCSGRPGDAWTEVCMTEAHLLVAVSRGGLDRFWREHLAALHGCELIVLGRRLEAGVFETLQ